MVVCAGARRLNAMQAGQVNLHRSQKYRPDTAKRLLGWEVKDRFEALYQRQYVLAICPN